MSLIQDSELFEINSANRSSGTNSNFSYKLDMDPNAEYDSVAVLDWSIPKTYYIIPDGYNTFTLQEGTTQATVTITPANYNRTSLKTVLETALKSASPNSFTYTITIENINQTGDTGKYTFSIPASSTEPKFIFTTGLYEQLGFEKNTTYDFVDNSLTSINVVNLNPEATLFLNSNICQNKRSTILQNIKTGGSASYAYIVGYNNMYDVYSRKMVKSKSNTYNFWLSNENGDMIDTNGVNIVFTIIIYKKNNIIDMLKNYIKMKARK